MQACHQLLPPSFALPSSGKKPQHVLFKSSQQSCHVVVSTVRLTHNAIHTKLSAALDDSVKSTSLQKKKNKDDRVKPWFSLFGMSFSDVYDEFPESVWDFIGQSPQAQRTKDLDQSRHKWSSDTDFDSRFAESIVFDRTLYKYAILGCKINAHKIMNEDLISPRSRDEIIHSLEKIEDDIELGKFDWKDGVDVHTNIVEALAYELGGLPKEIGVDSKHDSCLMILETWCKSNIDQILKQMKQLQVALVLLAIRNGGLDRSGKSEGEDNSLIENLVLPILKALDHDASVLCCILGFIYSSSNDVVSLRKSHLDLWNRYLEADVLCEESQEADVLCEEPLVDLNSKRFMLAGFTNSINYRITDHLKQLLEKLLSVKHLLSATQYDEKTTYDTIIRKFSPDEHKREHGSLTLSKCLKTIEDHVPHDCEIEHAKRHLFSSAKVVLDKLDLSMQFVEKMTNKVQIPLPKGYNDAIGFAHFLTSKGIRLETSYALVHLCLEKQLQPSDLTLKELQGINFPRERAHDLLQDKGSILGDFTCRQVCKEMLKWCCKLQISPETICT